MKTRMAQHLTAAFLAGLALIVSGAPAAADQGWMISAFGSTIAIGTDGVVTVQEDIRADFGSQQHHGIFRTIPIRYSYDNTRDRYLGVTVNSVTDGTRPLPFTTSNDGTTFGIKIGDPNVMVTGANRYVITYQVRGALNSFSDHDELYWNVDGPNWGVPKQQVTANVILPAGAYKRAVCYQGPSGSTEQCTFQSSGNTVTYSTTKPLASDEEMSIVAGLNKGAVTVPPPMLEPRQRQFPQDAFDVNPLTVGTSLLLLLIGIGLIVRYWWMHGRDRAYLGHYYQANDAVHDAPESPFQHEPVVVEFGPPQNMRPAQLGLILDEKADTKDVTATIVDLAVRGHLTISEVQGARDWLLTWKAAPVDDVLPYEKILLDGLFAGRQQVKLSELKGTCLPTLRYSETQVLQDAMNRRLFQIRPDWVRGALVGVGILVIIAGCILAYLLGVTIGWGLPGAAIAITGAVLIAVHGLMSVRTAAGRDLMQHTLGFRLYMTTAEKYRQQFAEKAEIFTQLLPYAIVFGCVTRWAKAFQGIDTSMNNGWYVGSRPFQAALIASSLQSMNSSISTAVSSTPAGSGASGFGGGGFSGGGGGGGGGGAW